jgi:hypothetical protein
MFRKYFIKNNKDKGTPEDNYRKELQNKLYNSSRELENIVKEVLARNIAISVYPDGADKEVAKEEASNAKFKLLCAIGNYDDIRCQLIGYIDNNVFYETKNYPKKDRLLNSHAVINNVCQKFYIA